MQRYNTLNLTPRCNFPCGNILFNQIIMALEVILKEDHEQETHLFGFNQ
jgi:hypothetical protein